MRRTGRQYVGNVGEARVRAEFVELGWGVPVKPEEDLGDDLIAFAHAEDLGDLGLPVVVQVKASKERHNTIETGPAGEPGWWYYEAETDHFDHWVGYGLPYLLILHDFNTKVSYWVHVRGGVIDATGKGRRIFVPAAQILDEAHHEELLAVAASPRTNHLEGSAWDGHVARIAESDRLRAALITPRLVAPFPNRSLAAIRFEEAVAMLMLGRLHHIHELGREGHCPPMSKWADHPEWGWRFAAALRALIDHDTIDGLVTLADQARHPFERVACLVVRACHALAGPHPSQAFTWLDQMTLGLGEGDGAREITATGSGGDARRSRLADEPVLASPDLGWVLAHRAHLLSELGERAAASDTAAEALLSLRHRPDDAAAAALRGGCAAVMLSAVNTEEALRNAVVEQDTAASWWRSQRLGSALVRDVEDQFRVWAGDTGTRTGFSSPDSDLELLRWMSAFSAAWSNWRSLTGTLGRMSVMRADGDAATAKALTYLRFASHKSVVRDAAAVLWGAGRFEALSLATDAYVDAEWHPRVEGPTLQLLGRAGDLLAPAVADQMLERVTSLLDNEGEMRRFAGGVAVRWPDVTAAVGRLTTASTPSGHANAIRWCAKQLAQATEDIDENLYAIQELTGAVRTITEHVSPSVVAKLAGDGTLARLLEVAGRLKRPYRWELMHDLAALYPPAEHDLQRYADAGDKDAVRTRLALRKHRDSDWGALADQRLPQVEAMIKEARGVNGTSTFTDPRDNRLHDLTLAAYHLNDDAAWSVVCDALECRALIAPQVKGALWFLARHFGELPTDVQQRLRTVIPALDPPQTPREPVDVSAAKVALEVVAGAVSDGTVIARVLALQRQGASREACEVLFLASTPAAVGMLVASCAHPDSLTRAAGAYFLIQLAASGDISPSVLTSALEAALGDANETAGAVADAVIHSIKECDPPLDPDVVDQRIIDRLGRHPSALIRRNLADVVPDRRVQGGMPD